MIQTHNIGSLIMRLPARARPDLMLTEQELLTRYATVSRYPGDYGAIPLSEARAAIKIARRVRKHVRARLSRQALKPV